MNKWATSIVGVIVMASAACSVPFRDATQSDTPLANEVSVSITSATTSPPTAPPTPCPLDIAPSVETASSKVVVEGRTATGMGATVIVPAPEPLDVAADGAFTYTASGYPVGETPNAVVIRVEGPTCAPVERGITIVRNRPPATTKAPKKPKAVPGQDCASNPSKYRGEIEDFGHCVE